MGATLIRVGILLFVVSLFFLVFVEIRRTIAYKEIQNIKEDSKKLAVQVGSELKRKAGSVVEENNISQLALDTILRFHLRTVENKITNYSYKDGNLIVNFESDGHLLHPNEYIWFRPVEIVDNRVIVSID